MAAAESSRYQELRLSIRRDGGKKTAAHGLSSSQFSHFLSCSVPSLSWQTIIAFHSAMKTRKPKNAFFLSQDGGPLALVPGSHRLQFGPWETYRCEKRVFWPQEFFSTVHFVQNQGAIGRLRQIICPLTKQKKTGAIHSVTCQAKGQAVQNTIICQDRLGTNTEQRENKRARVLFSDLQRFLAVVNDSRC